MTHHHASTALHTVADLADTLDQVRETLIKRLPSRVQHDPHLEGMHNVSDAELKSLLDYILASAAAHLRKDTDAWTRCYTFVANACFCLSLPLLETAYIVYALRDTTVDTLELNEADKTDEALAHLLEFFDRLVLEILRRY